MIRWYVSSSNCGRAWTSSTGTFIIPLKKSVTNTNSMDLKVLGMAIEARFFFAIMLLLLLLLLLTPLVAFLLLLSLVTIEEEEEIEEMTGDGNDVAEELVALVI